MNLRNARLVTTLMVLGLLVAAALSVVGTASGDASRTIEAPLPEWEANSATGTEWHYTNEPDGEEYSTIYIIKDTDGDPEGCIYEGWNIPTSEQSELTVKVIGVVGQTYNVKQTYSTSGGGNWQWRVHDWSNTDPQGDIAECPGPVGTVDETGTYTVTTGSTVINEMMKVSNLNTVSSVRDEDTLYTYEGDASFTVSDVIDGGTRSVETGEDADYKPTWSASPMASGNTWTNTATVQEDYTRDFEAAGDVSSGGVRSTAWDILWTNDYTSTVTSVADKSVSGFSWEDAFQMHREGHWEADWTATGSGAPQSNITIGPDQVSDNWWAFDAGNVVSYNETWSIDNPLTDPSPYPYDPFINTLPEVLIPESGQTTGAGVVSITIGAADGLSFTAAAEDEAYTLTIGKDDDGVSPFIVDGDIIVVDPDYTPENPDNVQEWMGELTFSPSLPGQGGSLISEAATEVLALDFTPAQDDVGVYIATLRMWDDYTQEDLGIKPTDPTLYREVVFDFVIENTNDPPTVSASKPIPSTGIDVSEGVPLDVTTFTIDQVFEDIDLTYDPDEELTFTYTGDERILVEFVPGPKYSDSPIMRITATDLQFPGKKVPVQMTLVATDEEGKSVSTPMLINVAHTNHLPVVVDDGIVAGIKNYNDKIAKDDDSKKAVCKDKGANKGECTFNEDTTITLDLKEVFMDPDWTGSTTYSTDDKLDFQDSEASDHVDLSIKSQKDAVLDPDENWNGNENVKLAAKDTEGETAEYDVMLHVTPVNDAPTLESQKATVNGRADTTLDLLVKETDDGKEGGSFSEIKLEVAVADVDADDTLQYQWTVYGVDDEELATANTDTYTFVTAFKGEFSAGDEETVYKVKLVVKDKAGEVAKTSDNRDIEWTITVTDVNRAPSIDSVAGTVGSTPLTLVTGTETKLKFKDNVVFDAGNGTTDLDVGAAPGEGLEDLDFSWKSVKGGQATELTMVDPNRPWILSLNAGKDLKPGTHEITVTVTDKGNPSLSDIYTFTVKVAKNEDITPGFEGIVFVTAMAAAVGLLARRRNQG